MKKVIIPVFLLALVACKNKDAQWAKDSGSIGKEIKEGKEKFEYAKWRNTKEYNLRYLKLSDDSLNNYIDSLAKVEYFAGELPVWYNEETGRIKKVSDSIEKAVHEQQRE